MRNYIFFLFVGSLLTIPFGVSNGAVIPTHTLTLETKAFNIDRIYPAMHGPDTQERVSFPERRSSEPVWVTAFKSEIINAENGEMGPQSFLCHSNFVLQNYGKSRTEDFSALKLGTPVQGHAEIRFPVGFGIPIYPTENVVFTSMLYSRTTPKTAALVKTRGTLEYTFNSELTSSLKPLLRRSFHIVQTPESKRDDMAAIHWMVPPGRHVYRRKLGKGLRMSYDTKIHYAFAHLHPYGHSLEIRDLTTGKSILLSKSEKLGSDGPGTTTFYSSSEGIPIAKDHEYEIVTVYDNQSGHEVDAMAIFYVYLEDKTLQGKRSTL